MRAAGFTEAAQENRVGGFQKNDFGRNHAPDRLQQRGKFFKFCTFANIDHEGGPADLTGLHSQFGKLGNQFNGEIIDAIVAQILEGFQHRSLAGSAHASDDDQFGRALPASFGFAPSLGLDSGGKAPWPHALDSSIEAPEPRWPASAIRDTARLKMLA